MASLFSSTASAQTVDDATRNAARSLAGQGKDAFDQADFERARDLFNRAYTLVPAPTIALYEGRALVKLRRFVEAEEAFMRAARTPLDAESPEAFRVAVHDSEGDLIALRARMPKVTIVVTGPSAGDPELSVSLDGHPLKSALIGVELPIDPGDHTLEAALASGEPARVKFSMVEKQEQRVEIVAPRHDQPVAASPAHASTTPRAKPAAPPPAASNWQAPTGLALGGVGVAGVISGIVTGLMAGSRYSKAERACPGHACSAGGAGWDDVQAFRSLRTVSTVSYIVGGVGLAAGTTLYLTAPSKHARAPQAGAVKVWINTASVGVAGAF
jgi:hypothetical protein